jgi:hypothetical protein
MNLDIVWAEYDKKGERVISKKVALQFFKDAVALFGKMFVVRLLFVGY